MKYKTGSTFTSSLQVKPPVNLSQQKIEYKAVRIRSTKPISVTMSDENIFHSRDITTIFPIEKLSTADLISSADPNLLTNSVDTAIWGMGNLNFHLSAFVLSQVVIVTVHDDTSVCISLPPHLRQDPYDYTGKVRGQTTLDNGTFEIKLNSLEPFQIFHFLDFSGTRISSSKPIAVFSGVLCRTSYDCNHIIEQLPPVDQFDVTFIVPPNHHTSTSLIRVISEENTILKVSSATKTDNVSISAGVPHDIETFDDEVLVIQSTLKCEGHQCKRQSPLLVNILSFREEELYSNRLHMTLVPGIHHYQRYYKIVLPMGWNQHYITVIIRENAASSLQMNGRKISNMVYWLKEYIFVEGVKYSIIVFEVGEGVVILKSEDAFGLIAYGYDGDKEAYAFTGNVLFH